MSMPPATVIAAVTTAIATAARRAVNGLFSIHLSSHRSRLVVLIGLSVLRAAAAAGDPEPAAGRAALPARPLDHVLAQRQEQHGCAHRAGPDPREREGDISYQGAPPSAAGTPTPRGPQPSADWRGARASRGLPRSLRLGAAVAAGRRAAGPGTPA